MHFADYNVLNWLFLLVPPNMWPYYVDNLDHNYPDLIDHPGDSAAYNKMASNAKNKITADLWAKDTKKHVESNHMNKALCCAKISYFFLWHKGYHMVTHSSKIPTKALEKPSQYVASNVLSRMSVK